MRMITATRKKLCFWSCISWRFYTTTLCVSADFAIVRCLSVRLWRWWTVST